MPRIISGHFLIILLRFFVLYIPRQVCKEIERGYHGCHNKQAQSKIGREYIKDGRCGFGTSHKEIVRAFADDGVGYVCDYRKDRKPYV